MRRFLGKAMKNKRLGSLAIPLVIVFAVGCSMGPSQKELDALEERRQAMAAAEALVAAKQAEKASLERKLAQKKDERQGLTEKRTATKAALESSETE